jgi:hypothetical protein
MKKYKYADDEFGIETEQELQEALIKFNCKTEDELDNLLHYTYGVCLINNIGK